MPINGIEPSKLYLPQFEQDTGEQNNKIQTGGKFVDTLNEFIQNVNTAQQNEDNLTQKLVKGEPVDIHNVMITAEKAKTTLQLLIELRNKFITMYQEIDRMQI